LIENMRRIIVNSTFYRSNEELGKRMMQEILYKYIGPGGVRWKEKINDNNCKIARLSLMPKLDFPRRARPVIREGQSMFSPLASWINSTYFGYMKKEKQILTDSRNLIQIIDSNRNEEKQFTKGDWLVAADVQSLYPSIPVNMAMTSLWKRIRIDVENEYGGQQIADLVLELMRFMFENTFIEYRERDGNLRYFRQNGGLAMGSPCSGLLANLCLVDIENIWVRQNRDNMKIYKRYQDDLCIIMNGRLQKQEVKNIMGQYNNLSTRIVLPDKSIQISKERIDYLDLTIFADTDMNTNRAFNTKTYTKEANAFMYISRYSYHPFAQKMSVINALNMQAIRNSSRLEDYLEEKLTIMRKFRERGFSLKEIRKALEKYNYSDRDIILKGKKEVIQSDEEKRRDILDIGKKKLYAVIPYKNKKINDEVKNAFKQAHAELQKETDLLPAKILFANSGHKSLIRQLAS
jgi:DNA-binding transcriptional MerR regulator